MVDLPRLSRDQREQVADARLLLEAAAHNAAILARHQGGLDEDRLQALANAVAQAAQAAGTLKRVAVQLKHAPDAPA